nr:hypothetical protein [Tanacetum cinerariifolium]
MRMLWRWWSRLEWRRDWGKNAGGKIGLNATVVAKLAGKKR